MNIETKGGEPADERAAFEAWIAKDSGDLSTFGRGSNMHYRNSAVNNAWTGWQARAALAASQAASHSAPEPVTLTDGEITKIAEMEHAAGRLAWSGFKKDDSGAYSIPVIEGIHCNLVRAVVSALAAKSAAPAAVLMPNGEPWDRNPDGIRPGEDSGPRMDRHTGMWDVPDDEEDALADAAVAEGRTPGDSVPGVSTAALVRAKARATQAPAAVGLTDGATDAQYQSWDENATLACSPAARKGSCPMCSGRMSQVEFNGERCVEVACDQCDGTGLSAPMPAGAAVGAPVTYLRASAGLHPWQAWELCGPDDGNGRPVYFAATTPTTGGEQ